MSRVAAHCNSFFVGPQALGQAGQVWTRTSHLWTAWNIWRQFSNWMKWIYVKQSLEKIDNCSRISKNIYIQAFNYSICFGVVLYTHMNIYIYICMYMHIYIYICVCVCGWTDDPKLTLAAVTWWTLSSRFIDVSPNHKWITEIWMQFKGCNISDPYWKITIGGWKRDSGKFTYIYIYTHVFAKLKCWIVLQQAFCKMHIYKL